MAETMYKRPNFVANLANSLVGALTRLGISPQGAHTVAVRGRKSGEMRTVPVNPVELDGTTYLVAPRGTTQWARNLSVAGEGELRLGRRVRRFRAEEIPDADKLPVLRAYLDRWAGQSKQFFEAEADAADERLHEIAPLHPAFRLSFED